MISSIQKDGQYIVIINPQTDSEQKLLSQILKLGSSRQVNEPMDARSAYAYDFQYTDSSPWD